jgi:hypothetical protein
MKHIPTGAPDFLYVVMHILKVIELYGALIRSPLLFVRDDACAESNISRMERRSGCPYFLYTGLRVKKV